MSDFTLRDNTTNALVTAMSGLNTRQRVIGNNIANVDTPGFKASDVSFASQLQDAMQVGNGLTLKTTDSQHIDGIESASGTQTISRQGTTQRLDGNNIDMEKEMAYLSETVLHHQAVTKLVSRRLAELRTVINEGRR